MTTPEDPSPDSSERMPTSPDELIVSLPFRVLVKSGDRQLARLVALSRQQIIDEFGIDDPGYAAQLILNTPDWQQKVLGEEFLQGEAVQLLRVDPYVMGTPSA